MISFAQEQLLTNLVQVFSESRGTVREALTGLIVEQNLRSIPWYAISLIMLDWNRDLTTLHRRRYQPRSDRSRRHNGLPKGSRCLSRGDRHARRP